MAATARPRLSTAKLSWSNWSSLSTSVNVTALDSGWSLSGAVNPTARDVAAPARPIASNASNDRTAVVALLASVRRGTPRTLRRGGAAARRRGGAAARPYGRGGGGQPSRLTAAA
jgi:hypothetical protein